MREGLKESMNKKKEWSVEGQDKGEGKLQVL